VQADPFSGQDTSKYKELAHKILEQIQLTTGQKEQLPGKDVDVVSLVTDDELLVQIFLLRLSLTFKDDRAYAAEFEA